MVLFLARGKVEVNDDNAKVTVAWCGHKTLDVHC